MLRPSSWSWLTCRKTYGGAHTRSDLSDSAAPPLLLRRRGARTTRCALRQNRDSALHVRMDQAVVLVRARPGERQPVRRGSLGVLRRVQGQDPGADKAHTVIAVGAAGEGHLGVDQELGRPALLWHPPEEALLQLIAQRLRTEGHGMEAANPLARVADVDRQALREEGFIRRHIRLVIESHLTVTRLHDIQLALHRARVDYDVPLHGCTVDQ